MTNFKKILVAGAVALGVTGFAQINASADEVTVKAGDTVSELAEAYGTTVSGIENLNSDIDKNTHLIYVGETLTVNESTVKQDEVQVDAAQSGSQYYYYDQPQAPVVQEATPIETSAPVKSETPVNNSSDEAAKAWIAQRESGGSYTAQNGQYYGKYQLSLDKLHGDLSPANQEKVAAEYANSRYGGWSQAQSAWASQNWW